MYKTISSYEEAIRHEIEETPQEYLPNLLQIIRLFRESVTLKPAAITFRQGWEEVMEGEVRPISELWRGIDARQHLRFFSEKRLHVFS